MKKLLKINKIYYLLCLSLLARLFTAYFYSDSYIENEWSILLHNYEISGILGFEVMINEYLALPNYAEVGERVLPTVFMPPLYFFFIYLIKLLSNNLVNFVSLIVFLQILLSLFSVIIFHKIIKIYVNDKSMLWTSTLIFAFFPLNVYIASQISSITLQIFLILLFFYFLVLILKNYNLKNLVIFSFISGLLILIRGEFFLFYFITIFYFFLYLKKNFKSILVSLLISLLTISPYLYRNYQHFDTFVLTKSFGFNLLKGNNPSFKVEGDYEFIEILAEKEEKNIKVDNNYSIKLDNYYKKKAIDYIKSEPIEYLKLYMFKVFSFIFLDFNSTYTNYFNFFHIFPKVIMSITSLIGAIISIKRKGFFQFLSFYYFLNIFLFSVFFILPRYSLILLPVQILLSIEVFKYLKSKLID
jgi:4-amino-4-deoxy-L-arabinose transferase-like glycosyltransferase